MATIPAAVSNGDFIKTTWGNAMATVMAEHVHDTTDGTTKIDLGDTTGSITSAQLPAAGVTQGKLAISTQTDGLTTASLSGGPPRFAHVTMQRQFALTTTWDSDMASGSTKITYFGDIVANTSFPASTNPWFRFKVEEGVGATWPAIGNVVARTRYITASPPWKFLDSDDWGMFLFVVRNKISGEVVRFQSCEDPPWMHAVNGLDKNNPLQIAARCMPYDMQECSSENEVVLIDLRHMQGLVEIEDGAAELGKLKKLKDKLLANGATVDELDAAENYLKEKKTKKLASKIEHALKIATIDKYIFNSVGLDSDDEEEAALITELKESIEATNELKEKDRKLIPQAFRHNNIRILRNPSKAL